MTNEVETALLKTFGKECNASWCNSHDLCEDCEDKLLMIPEVMSYIRSLESSNKELSEKLKAVNENFRNAIRYIKLYKDLPKKPDKKKLAVWTQTDTGLSVRGSKMPIPEFEPFDL